MALSDDEAATFNRLSGQMGRDRNPLLALDAYYEGIHRLETLGLAVPPELERFITTVNWPRITVDSVEQRCDIEGFRLAGSDDLDDDLWAIWQANGLDEESQQAHLDAMIFGRSYICIGSRSPEDPDPDMPLVTVESPLEVTHEIDPRTRWVSAALRKTRTLQGQGPTAEYATLYLPNETIWLERSGSTRGWAEVDRDEHRLGRVPVVPLVNRSRLKRRYGLSEMADVISLTDAACRALTNAQVATEVLAVPQRYVLGAAPKDFVDQDGNPVTQWETYFGAVWALQNNDAKVGQFDAADLKNFETIVNHYANLASGVSGLPTRFYGQYTTNPPTEGSIVADETRLIMNAYRKHRTLGGSWELGNRFVRRIIDGVWRPELARMETVWRNPETPTRAQQADAVTKLASVQVNGKYLMPLEMAREELGWSRAKRERARQYDEESAESDPAVTAVRQATRTLTDLTSPSEPVRADAPA